MAEDTKEVEVFLKGYRQAENNIQYFKNELSKLRNSKEDEYENVLKISEIKEDKVKGGPSVDRIAKLAAKLADVYGERETRYEGYIDTSKGQMQFIEDIVMAAGLNEKEEESIRYFYLKGLTAWKTADKILCSDRHFRRLKKQALIKIKKKLYI